MGNKEDILNQSYNIEVDEKVEKELNNINIIVNSINLNLDDLLQRAKDRVKAVQADYEDLETDFKKIKTRFYELEFKIDIQNLANYLIFLDTKFFIRLIDEKLKIINYIIDLFNKN